MLVQIVVAEQNVALGVELRVTSGASGLLHVILQRVGNVIVDHHAHILFIYSHAERGCCHDGSHLVVHEGILVGDFVVGIHFAVEGQRGKTVAGQLFGNLSRLLPGRNVDDGRIIGSGQQLAQIVVFLFFRFCMDDGVSEIGPRSCGGKQLKFQSQFPVEIVTDVGNDLLLGGGGEAGNRNGHVVAFCLLDFPDEVADVEVVHAEIMAPC